MRKDKLYLFTFLSISIIFIAISSVALHYFVKVAVGKVLDTQLEFSKREAQQVALLVGNQLENGVSKGLTIAGTQESLLNSNLHSGFVTIFDWSGKIICHPDVKQLGQQISTKESFVSSISDDITATDLYNLLQAKLSSEDTLVFNEAMASSEVVYLCPIKNSDWIVGAHANTVKVTQQIQSLRDHFQNILLIMGFMIILSSVVIVRLIGSAYEKKLELKNQRLSDEIINLTKLNSAVGMYQQKITSNILKSDDDVESVTKKRILTYLRHELVPISTSDISYIYTENTITYVVCVDGKKSTTSSSLDELFINLDDSVFFRANRQFIISIKAIDKIVRYGNSQLKILMNSETDADIIISKNRAAEFKRWLNM